MRGSWGKHVTFRVKTCSIFLPPFRSFLYNKSFLHKVVGGSCNSDHSNQANLIHGALSALKASAVRAAVSSKSGTSDRELCKVQ